MAEADDRRPGTDAPAGPSADDDTLFATRLPSRGPLSAAPAAPPPPPVPPADDLSTTRGPAPPDDSFVAPRADDFLDVSFAETQGFAAETASVLPSEPADVAADVAADVDLSATRFDSASPTGSPAAGPEGNVFATRLRSGDVPSSVPTLHRSAVDPWGQVGPATAAGAHHEPRFRILRPHAKGGLGEVFVAVDGELSREVALKEIQYRHADDPESRARFLLEAEVTGGLEHPGIVPVYGLGTYGDGRPYYAMRFIRGQSLEDAIRRFHEADAQPRDPGDREVALRQLLGRFLAVCDAMEYAHSRGVLHRDLKPANVMLGPFGETLVVDWGLAKALGSADEPGRPEEPGAGPLRPLSSGGHSETLFGSTIGTPHYMSPEQADGRLDLLGPPSDIYSLGATLYVLLAGRTPFTERTLETLLEKVRRGEFPPPRALKKRVPAALSAVCMKAMALRPEDRYPSARALAADIEHWLADEPVSVYREPLPARAARWSKRHKTLVTTAGALLVTTVLGLTAGSVLLRREQVRTEANFRMARDAVDQMLTELGEVELADVPQMEGVRRTMLGKALAFYLAFLKDRGDDRSLRREAALANVRLGDILDMLGDSAASERAYDRAIAALSNLAASAPDRPGPREDLARAEHNLGILQKKLGRYEESERSLRDALRLRRDLLAAAPGRDDYRRDEASTVYHLGALMARLPGRTREVEDAYAEALKTQGRLASEAPGRAVDRRNLARSLNNYGILLRTRDPREAEGVFRKARDIQAGLVEKSPSVAGLRWELGRTLSNLGATLDELRRDDDAAAGDRDALARFQTLADDFPAVPDYRHELSAVHLNLARVLERRKNFGDAEGHLREALALQETLARDVPKRPDYRLRLAETHRKLGILLAQTGRSPQAEAALRRAIALLGPLAAESPKATEYRGALGLALSNLAKVLHDRGDPAQARGLLEEAIRRHREALAANDRNAVVRKLLLDDEANLAVVLRKLGDPAGAARAAEELPRIAPDDPRAYCLAARTLAQCAGLARPQGPGPEPAYAGRALDLLRRALKTGRVDARELRAPEYDPIRSLPDFRAIQQSLEAQARPPVG